MGKAPIQLQFGRRLQLWRAMLAGVGFALATAQAGAAEAQKDHVMPPAELAARPENAPRLAAIAPGLSWLEVTKGRKAALFVPVNLPRDGAVPLVVLLHGAGGGAADILPLMQAEAEGRGFLLLAPQSQGPTWDVIMGNFGPDVALLNSALEQVFGSFRVDPERIAVAGFSDGASYALTLAVPNGLLFKHVLAFSPGFIAPTSQAGRPEIFISHGDADSVLPIDRCSRHIVPALRKAGYDVDYREFPGGHFVPADMVSAALDRFLGPDGSVP